MSAAPKTTARGALGRSVPRLEDQPLVSGQGRFVGDISFLHQLHMRVVRSPYAHAVLRAVDTSAAAAAPGIISVLTAADIADLPPIDFRDPANEGLRPYRQPLLAQDKLRYVGEPVAAVFATDPYLAEDAARSGLTVPRQFRDARPRGAPSAPAARLSPYRNTGRNPARQGGADSGVPLLKGGSGA
jgi:carbon-monoxide dehydrogenase large subunit/6-hydroxypseudooxynicotine dehydrogenase subunit gamma